MRREVPTASTGRQMYDDSFLLCSGESLSVMICNASGRPNRPAIRRFIFSVQQYQMIVLRGKGFPSHVSDGKASKLIEITHLTHYRNGSTRTRALVED